MSLEELTREHQRLVILRVLAKAEGYSANSSILQSSLDYYGLRCSRDVVHSLLAWLAEMGLVRTSVKGETGSVLVAVLTSRGADVAAGDATVPGVKRPRPGE